MEMVVDTSAGEPTPDHNTLLLVQSDTTNGSTDFADTGQKAKTITAYGDAQHSTAQSKFGASSLYFDGTGDYLSVGSQGDDDWKFAGTDFTVDFWMYLPTNLSIPVGVISTTTSPSTYASLGWHVGIYGTGADNGVLYWEGSNGSGAEGFILDSNMAPSATNTWHHVAVVRSGSTITLYKNGTSVGTSSSSGTMHTPQVLRIGRRDEDASPAEFNGYLDQVRVSNVARWDADFTPPTAAYGTSTNTTLSATGTLLSTASTADSAVSEVTGALLVKDSVGTNTLGTDLKAYFSSDNGSNWTEAESYDSSFTFDGTTKVIPLGATTLSNTGTAVKMKAEWANQVATVPATGTTKVISPIGDTNFSSSKVKFGNSAIYFRGHSTGDSLSIAASNDFNFGTDDFTIDYWVYQNSTAGLNWRHFGTDADASMGGFVLGEALGGGQDGLYMTSNGSSWNMSNGQTMGYQVPFAWSHLALVRSGNTFSLYRDGARTSTWTDSNAIYFRNTATPGIGRSHAAPSSTATFQGYIDEFRISNVALFSGASFSVPTAAAVADGTTTFLLHSDSNQEQIGQGVGTALGNMTDAGGLASAFDGAKLNQGSTSNGARSTVDGAGTIGKDWGNGVTKTITGVKWYGTSDGGLGHVTTLTLQGSTDNFSSSVVDLGYWTFTDNDNVITEKYSGFTTSTAYRYHRIKATASAGDVKCAELEFYEGAPGLTEFTDSSSNAHAITVHGDTHHQLPVKKIGTSSILFDGTGDTLSIADHADWSFGTNDFTIEFWIKTSSATDLANHGGGSTANTAFTMWLGGNGTNFSAIFCIGGSNVQFTHAAPNVADGSWHHLAVVRNGNVFTKYVDGTSNATFTNSGAINEASTPLVFGAGLVTLNGPGTNFNGHMDEIRISDTARYTADFTPSTTAFTTDANTKLLIHGDSSNPEGDSITDSSRAPEVIGKVAQLHGWAVNY